jgi:hypothetical protein
MDYKEKYFKYKEKYLSLKKILHGGSNDIYINIYGKLYKFTFSDSDIIKKLRDFFNDKEGTAYGTDNPDNIIYIISSKGKSKIIKLDKTNIHKNITEFFSNDNMYTLEKYFIKKDEEAVLELQKKQKEIDKEVFTQLLLKLKDSAFDKIIISGFSRNIDEHSLDKNITQHFHPTKFTNQQNIAIILYDLAYFETDTDIQCFDLIQNIKEVDIVDENPNMKNKNKIRKYFYNGLVDQLFIRKPNLTRRANLIIEDYLFKLNLTGMQSKNITFYVLNYRAATVQDSPATIIKENHIQHIVEYNFDGSIVIVP